MQATASFKTEMASRYMATLCKHFAQKVPVAQEAQSGRIEFPFGSCALKAERTRLAMVAQAESQGALDIVTEVITRHLERFAFRENPILEWHPDP